MNKRLYREIENNRVVWLRTLIVLERDECMIPYTYLTERMDTRALKHAACAPFRLASAILGMGTISTRTKAFKLDTAGRGAPPQYAIYLVPGGRWIFHTDRGLGANSGGPARISCTDLSDLGRSQRVCSFSLRSPVDTWPTINAVQSDPDNFRITIVVTYQRIFPLYVCRSEHK